VNVWSEVRTGFGVARTVLRASLTPGYVKIAAQLRRRQTEVAAQFADAHEVRRTALREFWYSAKREK
jgi:hypothetical protein